MGVPRVVFQDGDLQLATWSRVFINRWRSPAKKHLLEHLGAQQQVLMDELEDGKMAVFTVLQQKSNLMPDAAARKEAERVGKRFRDAVMLQAQVVEGDGFLAATARALLTGVNMAIRSPYPTKVFKTVDEALPWFEDHLRKAGYEGDAEGVGAAVRALDEHDWTDGA